MNLLRSFELIIVKNVLKYESIRINYYIFFEKCCNNLNDANYNMQVSLNINILSEKIILCSFDVFSSYFTAMLACLLFSLFINKIIQLQVALISL